MKSRRCARWLGWCKNEVANGSNVRLGGVFWSMVVTSHQVIHRPAKLSWQLAISATMQSSSVVRLSTSPNAPSEPL